jgi:hypothetical protein
VDGIASVEEGAGGGARRRSIRGLAEGLYEGVFWDPVWGCLSLYLVLCCWCCCMLSCVVGRCGLVVVLGCVLLLVFVFYVIALWFGSLECRWYLASLVYRGF